MNSYHPLLRDEQEWYLANASVTPTIEKLFFLRGPYRSDTGNQAYELHHQTYVYGYGPLYAQLARSKELESRNIPRARQVLHAVNILDWGTCSRIILGWNPDIVKVVVIAYDDQVMHTCVHFKDDKKDLFCSFIYAHNRYMQRRALWHNLVTHKAYVRDRPWCILGDFNVSLHVNDKSTGTSYIDRGMRDFQECVDSIEVLDVNSTGLRYTWNQKPRGGEGIRKKIDRIMANSDFYDVFVGSSAYFQPYRIS
ncbi:RNA-directed DNA polymerase, eukaryota, reverse transcriptase zinc-binding domain protein, partial [Tanacetum coccineum]